MKTNSTNTTPPIGIAETPFNITIANSLQAKSSNHLFSPYKLADKIAAYPCVKDKGTGIVLHFARFPDGAPTREMQNIQATTAIVFDFDGRGNDPDTVPRRDFEARCREMGIACLTWDTFSAPDDPNGCTFRAVLPLAKELSKEQYLPAWRACADQLAMSPKKALPATQAYFCQAKDGHTCSPLVIDGIALNLSWVEAEEMVTKLSSKIAPPPPLTELQINDAKSALDFLSRNGANNSDGSQRWHQIMGALAHHGETGRKLAIEFSRSGSGFDERTVINKLNQKQRNGATGIGRLFEMAQEEGWVNPAKGRLDFTQFPLNDVPTDIPDHNHSLEFSIDWPPGIVGVIAKHIHATSLTRIRSYSIAAGLFAVSMMSANRFYVSRTDTSLNLYMVLSGKTGEGKEAPRKAVKRMFANTPFTPCIFEKAASATGLLRQLESRTPPIFASMTDEYGLMLQGYSGVKANPNNQMLMGVMLNLFGSARSTYSPTAYANMKDNIKPIENPYFLLFGTTTPAMLLAAYTPELVSTGMVNRILVVSAAGHEPENTNLDFTVPKNIAEKIAEFTGRLTFGDSEKFEQFNPNRVASTTTSDTALEFAPGAFELLNSLALKPDTEGTPEELWTRYREHVIRVAGVLCVGEGTIITETHIRWAHSFVDWCHRSMAHKVAQQVGDGHFSKLTAKALDAITNAKQYASDRQFRSLCKNGKMPTGKLSKILRIPRNEKSKIIEYLLETEQIKQGVCEGSIVFWCEK